MEDVLIVCRDAATCRLIQSKLSQTADVRNIPDLSVLKGNAENSFDLVFIDVTLVTDDVAGGFAKIGQEFRHYNPLVQFVALAPKEMARKAVMAVRQGASEYLTYPIDDGEIDLVLELVQQNLSKNLELAYLRDKFWQSDWLDVIQTNNPEMRKVLEKVRSVAPTIATVLLLGETGTGKGLMARLIHRHSHRSEGPFVSVHCGAIPESLFESELFGHDKGAFTGAFQRKIGKFEIARNGTIFLDEIGTVSPSAQIKLLQVLQDGTFNRVGGTEQLQSNARIIAATNADLQKMAESGTFRKDLIYRLNVFPIELPPLRNRMEDLPHLNSLFLAKLNKKYGKNINGLHAGLVETLRSHSWPGNMRELENVLERSYILESGRILKQDNIFEPPSIDPKTPQSEEIGKEPPLSEARQIATDQFEYSYLVKLLKKHRGKINLSAKEARITTRQLTRLLTKHGLDKTEYKD